MDFKAVAPLVFFCGFSILSLRNLILMETEFLELSVEIFDKCVFASLHI